MSRIIFMEINNFSARITKIRSVMGLNQSEMAKSLGVSQGFLSDVEKGKKIPGSDFLISLKKYCNVSIDWLITGNGNMFDNIPEKNATLLIVDIVNLLSELGEDVQKELLRKLKREKLLSDLLEREKNRGYC